MSAQGGLGREGEADSEPGWREGDEVCKCGGCEGSSLRGPCAHLALGVAVCSGSEDTMGDRSPGCIAKTKVECKAVRH